MIEYLHEIFNSIIDICFCLIWHHQFDRESLSLDGASENQTQVHAMIYSVGKQLTFHVLTICAVFYFYTACSLTCMVCLIIAFHLFM